MKEPWGVGLETVVAFVVGVVAVARITKLVVEDDFPPVVRFRGWVVRKLPADWAEGIGCPFCVSVYFALADLLAAWISGLAFWWWLINLWPAGAYLSAMVVARDLPPDQRDTVADQREE